MVVELGLKTETSSEGGTDWAVVNATASVEARSENLIKYIGSKSTCVYVDKMKRGREEEVRSVGRVV